MPESCDAIGTKDGRELTCLWNYGHGGSVHRDPNVGDWIEELVRPHGGRP